MTREQMIEKLTKAREIAGWIDPTFAFSLERKREMLSELDAVLAALPASAPAVPDAEGKCPFQPGNCYWPSCGCRPPAAPPAVSAPPVTPEMPTVLIGDRVAYGEYPLTTVLGPLTAEAHNRHGWNVTAIERNGRVIWRKAETP